MQSADHPPPPHESSPAGTPEYSGEGEAVPDVVPSSVAPPIAPPSDFVAPSTPSSTLPQNIPEPVAPIRSTATNPLMAMLGGGVLACLLFGTGLFMGSRSSNTPAPVGGVTGISADSGNAIVRAVATVGP